MKGHRDHSIRRWRTGQQALREGQKWGNCALTAPGTSVSPGDPRKAQEYTPRQEGCWSPEMRCREKRGVPCLCPPWERMGVQGWGSLTHRETGAGWSGSPRPMAPGAPPSALSMALGGRVWGCQTGGTLPPECPGAHLHHLKAHRVHGDFDLGFPQSQKLPVQLPSCWGVCDFLGVLIIDMAGNLNPKSDG